jgi:hypothetical protein
MNTPKFSITIVTAGMIIFTVLCNSRLPITTGFLIGFLILLHIGLIWMVVCILKNGKPSDYTFEQRFYDDVDFKKDTGKARLTRSE